MSVQDLLVPVQKFTRRAGTFRFGPRPVLASANTADTLPLGQLAADLKRRGRTAARIERNAFGPADVRIRRDPKLTTPDAYRIDISPAGVEIAASADAGAYYAVQTLRELLTGHGRRLPCGRIDDRPDFPRRGVYYDCARGKIPTVETFRALIERLARWKINELQLYIENGFTWKRHPAIGRGWSPLAPQELLDIQAHAKKHHIRLVGSLASFGHMGKVLSVPAYRHLAESGYKPGVPGDTQLCPVDPRAFPFLTELYEELVPLFEAEDFNSCCDETWTLGEGRSKKRAAKVGKARLYLDWIVRLNRLNHRFGKRMNIWGDIILQHPELLKDLPEDLVFLNWDYNPAGPRLVRTAEVAAAGVDFMVCPGTGSWQEHGSRLDWSLRNVEDFSAQGRKHGAVGLLNTDWGDCGHRNTLAVSLHGFAHGAAHAWNGAAVPRRRFTDLFCRHVFDQTSGRMADAIRTLGSSYRCWRRWKAHSLYHALVEPLTAPRPTDRGSIDHMTARGMEKVLANLDGRSLWPAPPKSADAFDRQMFRQFELATQMDILAAKRVLAAKKIRAGKAVPGKVLRALAAETRALARRFEKLWLAQNKPSRLRDNLRDLRAVAREADRLARK